MSNALRNTLTAALLGGLCLSVPTFATAAPLFGSNLIVNGSAEADTGSNDGAEIGAVTGFAKGGQFTVVKYGASGGFPFPVDPGPADRGKNFFAGGPSAPSSSGSQAIDLSGGASSIDSGKVGFDLSAYLGGYSSQGDNAVLSISFLDASNASLGSASIGPVTAGDRASATGLLLRDTTGFVPVGTRSVALELLLTRTDGTYNDGYADNLSFVLTAVPEPGTWALLGLGLAAVAARARRRVE